MTNRLPSDSDIDSLIKGLERMMDSLSDPDTNKEKVTNTYSDIIGTTDFDPILLSNIWKGFLEHCRQNELDPNRQIREAVASNYQDLLKSYKIRAKLAIADNIKLV